MCTNHSVVQVAKDGGMAKTPKKVVNFSKSKKCAQFPQIEPKTH
jgi:hypothetical protein